MPVQKVPPQFHTPTPNSNNGRTKYQPYQEGNHGRILTQTLIEGTLLIIGLDIVQIMISRNIIRQIFLKPFDRVIKFLIKTDFKAIPIPN